MHSFLPVCHTPMTLSDQGLKYVHIVFKDLYNGNEAIS